MPADAQGQRVDAVAVKASRHCGPAAEHGHQFRGEAPDNWTGAHETAERIGSLAGAAYPNVEQPSGVAMRMSVEEDFDRGLRMLLDGVAARGAS